MAIPFLTPVGLGLRRVGQVLTGAVKTTAERTTKAARSVYGAVRGAVARGVSDTAIGGILRRTGIDIPAGVADQVIAKERRRRAQGAALQFLARRRTPNPDRLPLSLTPIARRYAFLVRISGVDVDTGEDITKFVTISSDELMSREDIERRAEQFLEDDPEKYKIRNAQFQLFEGMKSPLFEGGIEQ